MKTEQKRLLAILDRFDHLVQEAKPHFEREEWLAIFDTMLDVNTPMEEIGCMWLRVLENTGLEYRYKVNQKLLSAKLTTLSIGQSIAVVELAERYTAMINQIADPVGSDKRDKKIEAAIRAVLGE